MQKVLHRGDCSPVYTILGDGGPDLAMCAVILACRDSNRGVQVSEEVEEAQAAAGFPAQTQVVALDQASVESSVKCANEVIATNTALHILINNGGIYDMGGMCSESEGSSRASQCHTPPLHICNLASAVVREHQSQCR